MCMEAKNEYSEILYCATSLLIVMLSAREIFFLTLYGQWNKDTCKTGRVSL